MSKATFYLTLAADDARKPTWSPVFLVESVVNGVRDWSFTTKLAEATSYVNRPSAIDARNREFASRGPSTRNSLRCEVQQVGQ